VPVPVPSGADGSTGTDGVPSGTDSHAHPNDPHAPHDRRRRRRK
jgi:hypothetical protein